MLSVGLPIDWVVQAWSRLSPKRSRTAGTAWPMRDLLGPMLDGIAERSADPGRLTTGYMDLDRLLGGLQPSTLVVVGGPPSVGKASFVFGIALHVGVGLQEPVLIVTTERGDIEITERMTATQAGLDLQCLRKGAIAESGWQSLGSAVKSLCDSKLSVLDLPYPSKLDLAHHVGRMARTTGVSLVVLDRLQGLDTRNDGDGALGLKSLALGVSCSRGRDVERAPRNRYGGSRLENGSRPACQWRMGRTLRCGAEVESATWTRTNRASRLRQAPGRACRFSAAGMEPTAGSLRRRGREGVAGILPSSALQPFCECRPMRHSSTILLTMGKSSYIGTLMREIIRSSRRALVASSVPAHSHWTIWKCALYVRRGSPIAALSVTGKIFGARK